MDYKQYHEQYMQNLNGTTSLETFLLILPSFFEVFIATILSSLLLNNCKSTLKNNNLHFIIDFFIIIVPMILIVTIVDKKIIYLFLISLITIILSFCYTFKDKQKDKCIVQSKRFFITNARSTIMIISIIAILAVDFKIFPRRFAKTETFGYSLMDVGVGLFVFSNGIVAPEIRKSKQTLLKSIISSIPLWILGSARFLFTESTNYHVHVSEYGVHWNFFITLAVTKIISSMILTLVNFKYSVYISTVLLIIHELLLQNCLSNWVLNNEPRRNFLLANKEGITSSLGYVGLYFFSIHIGNLFEKSKKNHGNDSKLYYTLCFTSMVLLSLVLLMEDYLGVSRRLANSIYCLWILFLGTFMCLLFFCAEHINKYLYNKGYLPHQVFVPLIYEAVTFNGLACFLLANILTGLINLNIQTLTIEPLMSLCIIIVYMFIVCLTMTFLYSYKIKLKLW